MSLVEIIPLRLTKICYAASEVCTFEFLAENGSTLPAAEPGAHITLHLPNGISRQYSLLHIHPEAHHYEIGVKRDPNSRGGSRFMHETLRVGSIITATPPRNNFPLNEHATESVLIAGGIGITPIVAMAERLAHLGRRFHLHYACRRREEVAFLPELQRICEPNIHVDEEHGGSVLDIATIIASALPEAHLYCCGPGPMLKAFETATANTPVDQVHLEYFTQKEAPATTGGYVVELARSNKEFLIPPGRTILQVLLEAGVAVNYSCEEGICATCETTVLSGIPDHRDSVLSATERATNRTMMICCSGSQSGRLVLDL